MFIAVLLDKPVNAHSPECIIPLFFSIFNLLVEPLKRDGFSASKYLLAEGFTGAIAWQKVS